MNLDKLIKRYRIADPEKFRLGDFSPGDRGGLGLDKHSAQDFLAKDSHRLADLQERLYAQDRWSILVVFQGMDAAGKDSVIKHVMSGINPQGCDVTAFKQPSAEELDHDFLWRAARALPERGRIGIFNRSYYEDVLVVRVHRKILEGQKLPPKLVTTHIWQERFKDIRSFERHLQHNGTLVLKFFLYVSKDEQKKRFLERLEEPAKQWKFSMGDVEERKLWDRYMTAYEEMVRHTSSAHSPWHVVPADHKWFTQLVVAATIIKTLEQLDLKFPGVKREAREQMKQVRKALLAEASSGASRPRPDRAKKKRRKLSGGRAKSSAPRRRSDPQKKKRRKLSGSRAKSSRVRAVRVPRRRGRQRKPRAGRRRAPR
jgi:PPK2 family polyphosphate:nucleotide phosphotransferase